ncbi:uncharacterized protein N7496_006604 [Penicillium cataractarum]|uniref:Zn(2)-C6 fungal-type domain-containing protein n=1 Tax=Penicillium cataractarum TaxID=2100454 RepID=A0A9W9V6G5_9EURO|nr:uncharacterized protein N7496_006604 [Penicillium cataractarum]KAJ5370512.1 hypothetical protein N7496_006604 [Penicillium cataractarum]
MSNSPSRTKSPLIRRSRLAVACNPCREAKVRCDVSHNACRRCQERGYDCVATDPKTGEMIPRRLAKTTLSKRAKKKASSGTETSGKPGVPNRISRSNSVSGNIPTIPLDDEHQSVSSTCSPYAQTADGGPSTHASTHPEDCWPSTVLSTEEAAPPLSEDLALEVGAVQNNDGENRLAVLGSTNMQILAAGWIDRYFAYLGQPFRVSGCFKYGMRHAVEGGKPRDINPAPVVSQHMHDAYLDAYNQAIYPLFPVFDTTSLPLSSQSLVSGEDDLCLRAVLLAVYSLGADSIAKGVTPEGTAFLYEAYSLVVELMNNPYLTSIQALVLISLAFRSRAKDGQAALTISLAIKMALCLGFHRHIQTSVPESDKQAHDRDSRFPISSRLLHETLEADDALKAWYHNLPLEIKSGVTPSSTVEAPFYAFLILYYYQCLILVHRTALTTREESYRVEVAQRYQIGSRQYKQLLSSQSCCYNSALEMIKIFHTHEEYGISHRLIPISHISYAAVVLSVWILRHPFSSFHAVNIANLDVACKCAQRLYQRAGQDVQFTNGWSDWYNAIQGHLNYQISAQPQATATLDPLNRTQSTTFENPLPLTLHPDERVDTLGTPALNPADLDIWDWSTFLEFPVGLDMDLNNHL